MVRKCFWHNSLQFVANAYENNMRNQWDYTYQQVTVDYIDHIQSHSLGNWVANHLSCNL